MGLVSNQAEIIPATASEAYVVPADTVTNRINIKLVSTDSVSQSVRIWFVPTGGAPTNNNYLVVGMETVTSQLKSGEVRVYPTNQVLSAGDKIFWEADDDTTDHQIIGKLDINEVPAAGQLLDGFLRVYEHNDDHTIFLPSSLDLAYTVPTSPLPLQLVQFEGVFHNSSADREAFTMSAVPTGQTPGDLVWIISSNTQQWHLAPGETRLVQFEHFLTAGYEIHWRALNANAIVGRLAFEGLRAA